MITLLLSFALMIAGVYLLRNKLNIREEDISLMFAGAMLLGAVQSLAAVIVLLFTKDSSGAALIGNGISLLLNSAIGYYFLRQARVL